MKVLVAGANGQVGHELLRAFAPDFEITAATRTGQLDDGTPCATLDLTDADSIMAALAGAAPNLIINAAAYTAVDQAEDEPKLAQRCNADALRVMGKWAVQHGARIVHYSTDYVFDGTATEPYHETDPTHPVSAYGRSKLGGEIALGISGARYLIFRTAWVYAARGKNFLRTMLRLGAERDELRVVDDQVGAPTPAALIADVTAQVVAKWCDQPDPTVRNLDGLYHLVASGQTSWCGFARAIFERQTAIPLDPPSRAKGEATRKASSSAAPRITAITTADYPTKATRPAYSVLDTTKLRKTFGVELPDWQTGLDGVIAELAAKA